MKSWQLVLLSLFLSLGAALAAYVASARELDGWWLALVTAAVAFVVQIVNPLVGRIVKQDTQDLLLLALLRRWSRAPVGLAEVRARYRFDPLPVEDARWIVASALDTTLERATGKNRWKGDLPRADGYYQTDLHFEGDDEKPSAAVIVVRAYGPRAPDLPRVLHSAHSRLEDAEKDLAAKGRFRRDGTLIATVIITGKWPKSPTEVQARIEKSRRSNAAEVELKTLDAGVRAVGNLGPATLSDIRDVVVLYPAKK